MKYEDKCQIFLVLLKLNLFQFVSFLARRSEGEDIWIICDDDTFVQLFQPRSQAEFDLLNDVERIICTDFNAEQLRRFSRMFDISHVMSQV